MTLGVTMATCSTSKWMVENISSEEQKCVHNPKQAFDSLTEYFVALQSFSPFEPQCCQSDLWRELSSDWPAPLRSSHHQKTSQSAAGEAPQCPALTTPTSEHNKESIHQIHQSYLMLKSVLLSQYSGSFLMTAKLITVKIKPQITFVIEMERGMCLRTTSWATILYKHFT